MSLHPESIDWLFATFKTLITIPRNNRFFQERRYAGYILWIEKTSNRRGCIAEIYRVDDKGRKCCILIPEGYNKIGWNAFLNLITLRGNKVQKDVNHSTREQTKRKTTSTDRDSSIRTFMEALTSSNNSDESQSLPEENLFANTDSSPGDMEDSLLWENTIVTTRQRCRCQLWWIWPHVR